MLIVHHARDVLSWATATLGPGTILKGVLLRPVVQGHPFTVRYQRNKLTEVTVNDQTLSVVHATTVFGFPAVIRGRNSVRDVTVKGIVVKYPEVSQDAFYEGVRTFSPTTVGRPEGNKLIVNEDIPNHPLPTDLFIQQCLLEQWRLASFTGAREIPPRTASAVMRAFESLKNAAPQGVLLSINAREERELTQSPDCYFQQWS